jgi:GMP synthase (glutamine-hydrolysing)
MRLLIVNSAEPEVTEFAENIARIVENEQVAYELINYRDCLAKDFSTYDGVLISGSPQGDDIVEHHQPFFQWIKTYDKPVLGICAGHHITGVMHGAEYLRSQEPESDDCEVEIILDDPVFAGIEQAFTTRQMHNDSVTLPEGFIHLAKSKVCFNQAMKHRDKALYTFQFHPEYRNPELIQNFIHICKRQAG